MVDARLRVYLLGHRIAYSSSPAMQAAGFRAARLDWSYELLDIPPEELGAAVERLRDEGVGGANVTIPHKVAVIEHLDALDRTGEIAGSVNTIAREGERLVGYNTDVAGMGAALQRIDFDPAPGRLAVVLGIGGSARAAAVALEGAEVAFVGRHPERASDLGSRVLAWEDPRWSDLSRRADLLLNATPLGRNGELAVPSEHLPAHGGVIDLVYVAGGTPLVLAARSAGLPCVDGWEVLLKQGAAAFEVWTGRPAPLEAMRTALVAESGGDAIASHPRRPGEGSRVR